MKEKNKFSRKNKKECSRRDTCWDTRRSIHGLFTFHRTSSFLYRYVVGSQLSIGVMNHWPGRWVTQERNSNTRDTCVVGKQRERKRNKKNMNARVEEWNMSEAKKSEINEKSVKRVRWRVKKTSNLACILPGWLFRHRHLISFGSQNMYGETGKHNFSSELHGSPMWPPTKVLMREYSIR